MIEMPPNVRMSVDKAGRYGQACQVIHDGVARGSSSDATDFFSLDDENGVAQNVALTIENCRGLEHHRTLLRECGIRTKCQEAREDAQNSNHLELLRAATRSERK